MIADYIRHLRELTPSDASSVGAKAATLGELMLAGFRVPGGFCVPAAGYRHFVACAGLERRLSEIFDQADFSDPSHCEGAAAEIRRLFLAARLPHDLRRALEHAYLALSHRAGEDEAAVAVRPSPLGTEALALPPGYHESLLNVVGVEALGAALKQCWASLHSSQALERRSARDMPHASALLPVIVQNLVGAAISGSMFTADRQSGDPLRIVIEACFGLGEGSARSSLATDRVVVDAATMAVLERAIADKALMLGRAEESAQGTIVVPVPQARRRAPALSDEQAVALARVGMQIDQHFNARCEVGWAIADGEIFVTGARPMAHLPAFFPVELARDRRPSAILKGRLRMSLKGRTFALSLRRPDPVPPLSGDLWRSIVRRFERCARWSGPLGLGFRQWQAVLLNGYHYAYHESRDPWRPRSLPIALLRFLLQAAPANRLHARWRGAALPRAERARQRLSEMAPREPSSPAAAGLVLELLGSLDELLGYAFLLGPLAREARMPVPRLLAWLLGARASTDDLLGAADDATTQHALALWRLTRQAREHWSVEQALAADQPDEIVRRLEREPEGREFIEQVRRFAGEQALLDPLALADLDSGPAWLGEVGAVLMAARQTLSGSEGSDPEAALRGRTALRERAAAEGRARLSAGAQGWLRPWRRWLFDYALRTALALEPLACDCREDAPMRAAASLREGLRLLADALVRDGFLESPEEIAFLTLADIEALARGSLPREEARGHVESRRRRLRRQACLTPPARIAPSVPTGAQADAPKPPAPERLCGAPCSPGQATGPARHMDSPRDLSHFRRGDVLICGRAGAAQAILFSMAAAFVQEEDAMNSHCALLARQYGVPGVAGVSGLARVVRDGQVVTVDGTSGTVSVEPEAHA